MLITHMDCSGINQGRFYKRFRIFFILISSWALVETDNVQIFPLLSVHLSHAQTTTSPPSLPMPASGAKYSIPTKYEVGTVSPANLDGDGLLDWVIRRNLKFAEDNENLILEARDYFGNYLWEYDTGINKIGTIDRSGWHEAIIVWNIQLDTDWDEVIVVTKRSVGGQVRRYLTMLDGKTGEVIAEREYPRFPGSDSRRYAAIAYFGNTPYIVIAEAVTHPGGVTVFDADLRTVWRYEHPYEMGTGHHGVATFDLDEDGNDEIIYGGTTIDAQGRMLWSLSEMLGYGHQDVVVAGNIVPGNGRNEVAYIAEVGNGALVVSYDGENTDKDDVIWHFKEKPPGGYSGLIGNFDPNYPGDEIVIWPDDCDDFDCTGYTKKMFSAHGEDISSSQYFPQRARRRPDWNGDGVYDKSNTPCPGICYGADVGGGLMHGAEEAIRIDTGKAVEVFFNTQALSSPSRWQNRRYRQDVAMVLNGYSYRNYPFRVHDIRGTGNLDQSSPEPPTDVKVEKNAND